MNLLKERIATVKKNLAGKRVVLVGGCFDILHYGHIVFLEKARNLGDALVVALEPDSFIISHKKRIPLHSQKKREKILYALRSVDAVISLPVMKIPKDYEELVAQLKPSFIAVTSPDPKVTNKKKMAHQYGARVVTVNRRVLPHSSSAMATALRSR